jgi:polar amino acid transport system permease protein
MNSLVQQFLNFEIMAMAMPMLLKGLWMTVQICLVVAPLSIGFGLALALLGRSQNAFVRIPTSLYVDLFRSLPPLVLVIFVASGLPFLGVRVSPFFAVVIAFVANSASYYCEIFRAGLASVPVGQWEAARSTGLTNAQTARYVIIPQAVRNVLPDLISNTIELVKATTLASVVALGELLYAANMARSVTYNASPIVLAAVIYLIILWPCVRLLSRLENKTA